MRFAWQEQYGIDKNAATPWLQSPGNMLAFSAKHNIESVVDVMPFSKMNEAMEILRSGNVSVRLVLENR